MAPDYKQIPSYFGGLYYHVKSPEKGAEFLTKNGFDVAVGKRNDAPKIDGEINEDFWQNAAKHPLAYKRTQSLDASNPLAKCKNEVRIACTKDALYIACTGDESRKTELVARYDKPDKPVWKDDSFQILLNPGFSQRAFYQIVVNSRDAVFNCNFDELGNSDIGWDSSVQVKSKMVNGVWNLEAKIPFDKLNCDPSKGGTVLGLDLCRISRCDENEYASLYPVYGDFHPSGFGIVTIK